MINRYLIILITLSSLINVGGVAYISHIVGTGEERISQMEYKVAKQEALTLGMASAVANLEARVITLDSELKVMRAFLQAQSENLKPRYQVDDHRRN